MRISLCTSPLAANGLTLIQMKLKFIFCLSLVLFVSACASTPSEESGGEKVLLPPPAHPEDETSFTEGEPGIPPVDYVGLQHILDMDRAPTSLGFKEKSFDTCVVGHGYSHSDACRTEHFAVIHFQLMCRNGDETSPNVALSSSDYRPIANRTLDWTLSKRKGHIQTDESGYGQIRMAFKDNPREQRLKINLGQQFLYMRAGDIERVVTPPVWCSE